jgi:hypothetical protein
MSHAVAHPTVRSMPRRWLSLGPCLAAVTGCLLWQAAPGALAQEGLQWSSGDALWPSLRARITLQTAAVSPLKLADWGRLHQAEPGFNGGAVLGDYVFAQPEFGSFRATTGLFFGAPGEQPRFGVASYGAGSRLGLALGGSGARQPDAEAAWQAMPYLGVGFSSPLGDSGFSLSADLGLLAEPGNRGTGLRLRASEPNRRDLRLAPLLQFGMRYTF